MRNRVATLFELDELLGSTTNGNGHGQNNGHAPTTPRRRRRKKMHGHAVHGGHPGSRRGRYKDRTVDRTVDRGDPIRCEHNVPYKPVPPVDVKEATPPEAPTAPAPAAQQLGEDDYDVEAFEEPDEDDSLRLEVTEDEELEYPTDEESLEQSYRSSEPPRSESTGAYPKPRAFATQMDAVERDLADLASRVQAPSPDAAPDTAREDEEAASVPPPPAPHSGHAVFDQMAKGMAYATEFRLPAVQLSQVFSVLDKQLDAEERQKNAAVPPPVVRPGPPAASAGPTITPPDSATLIKDLVEMPGMSPPGSPTPVETAPAQESPVVPRGDQPPEDTMRPQQSPVNATPAESVHTPVAPVPSN